MGTAPLAARAGGQAHPWEALWGTRPRTQASCGRGRPQRACRLRQGENGAGLLAGEELGPQQPAEPHASSRSLAIRATGLTGPLKLCLELRHIVLADHHLQHGGAAESGRESVGPPARKTAVAVAAVWRHPDSRAAARALTPSMGLALSSLYSATSFFTAAGLRVAMTFENYARGAGGRARVSGSRATQVCQRY